MKKILFILLCGLLPLNLCGCKTVRKFIPPIFPAAHRGVASLPAYSGPKARIAVADFDVEAAKVTTEISSELRQALLTVLTDSRRFLIVERPQPADLIISARVAEFEPEFSGGSDGLAGGGGVYNGSFGGLLGTSLNKAHMALDIRVVNSSTSEVIAATQVKGQAKDSNLANKVVNLVSYADTPMGKAIQACIIEAVRYIIQAVPNAYYRY